MCNKTMKVTIRLMPHQYDLLQENFRNFWGSRDAVFRRFVDALNTAVADSGPSLIQQLERGQARIVFKG